MIPAVDSMIIGSGILAGYLLGSIPSGYLWAKAKGVDIRSLGSGNIGATNVFRILGKTAGISVLLLDLLKGLGAVLIGSLLTARFGPEAAPSPTTAMLTGFAGILGHNYTCWLKFKGGKGIATSAGVLLGLMPAAFGMAVGVWLVFFAATRYVSVASIAAALSLPAAAWLSHQPQPLLYLATLMGVLAIWKHRSNIQRLLKGTENRVGRGSRKTGGEA